MTTLVGDRESEPVEHVRRVRIVIETDRRTINSELSPGPVNIALLDTVLASAAEKAISASGVELWSREVSNRDRPTSQWPPGPDSLT